jgi:DNA polymerase-3 subunit beta
MKPFQVRIAREALLALINPLMAVVGRTTTVANGIALGNLKLHAEQGRLYASASNGITTVENHVDAEVKADGTCYLPARKLFEIARALTEGAQVDMQAQKDWAVLRVPRSSYKLHNSNPDMFPSASGDVVQEGVKAALEIMQKDLQQALTETSYCMGVNDVRVMLNGLLFDVRPDEMRLIGTDGHRMALSKLRFNSGATIKAIVPNETIHFLTSKLAKSEEPVRIEFSERYCRITIDKLVYQTQLVSGRPVEYEAVIPTNGKNVRTQRRELIGVIERAKIVANPKFMGVHIHVESGQIGVSANNPEQEDSRENLDASTEFDGLNVGFNANYLIQALQSIEADEVTVSMRDAGASVIIHGGAPERHINVVMPLRI